MCNKVVKVLCVVGSLRRGGTESMCMNLYRNIDRDKVQFVFVKHEAEKGDFEDEIVALGGKIYTAPRYKIYNYFFYKRWWKNFFHEHKDINVVHGHISTLASIFLKEAKQNHIPTIVHSHNIRPRGNWLLAKIKHFSLKNVCKYADYNFACSNKAGKYLFKGRKYTVLKNAIDTDKYLFDDVTRCNVRKQFNIKNEVIIGTVGNISYAKNPMGVLDIFEAFHKKNNNSMLMWIGGYSEDMYETIKLEKERRNLMDSVLLLGKREDVPYILQGMDVFILPSLYEGLGMVVIEAQASGLSCVCSTNVPTEVNITGNCSFVSLDDIEKWVEEINNNLSNIRKNTKDFIKNSGYDIHSTSGMMTDFYYKLGINKK